MSGVDELTDDVIAFISEGTRTGKLGYTASDGRPLVAPIWFVVDNGELAFNTGKNTAKGRALARDSRAVICVDDQRPPYSFVQVQGTVSIIEDPDDLLDIAKVEAGKMAVNPTEVPVTEVRDLVERSFRPVADQKQLGFRVDVQPGMSTE